MRYRTWVFGLTGCLLMAGSVYGFVLFMKRAEWKLNAMETVMPVRMLQSGEVIQTSMLRKVVIATAAHHTEGLTDPKEVVGKTVVAPIASNEEIAAWKLSDGPSVPLKGERYFSFKTDAVANVNNMVRRGDRVDVWVEFAAPKPLQTTDGTLWSVGAVKIIEGLTVSAVKTAEGAEVSDTGALEAVVQSNRTQLHNARSKPLGKPELNTYIMNDEIYDAYVLGTIGGTIKLALPDLTAAHDAGARVTGLFRELKAADAFTKTPNAVSVRGEIKRSEVSGQELPGWSAAPEAKATEVK
ncbi:SAF domain-containing protein [Paenibacillus solanacearum]|nr:SAF domain-containing protein [Paenibacillus solanacearum]